MKAFVLMLGSLSTLSVGSAFADPSKIIGTWTSACEVNNGFSYQNRAIFQENGVIVNIDLNYQNDTTCSTTPSEGRSEAPYQVTLETAEKVVFITQPPARADGEPTELEGEFTFLTATSAQLKALSAKVLMNGTPTPVPATDIAQFPIIVYTKN
jgi:hypothetical protein